MAEVVAPPAPDLSRLKGHRFATVEHSYSERDSILYALGLGIGHNPCSSEQLRFVQGDQVVAVPTMAAVVASPTDWMRDPSSGIDLSQLVALSHHIEILCPFPAAATVHSRVTVTDVFDRGASKGAVIHWERELFEASSGTRLAVLRARALARNNGGFGGATPPLRTSDALLSETPEVTLEWPTQPIQGLLYRLSGDFNPLHSDPMVAAAAGFERPILHGLCTLGICGFVLGTKFGGGDVAPLKAISGRYCGVVYPGETLLIDAWGEASQIRFRCRVHERNAVVVEQGTARCN